MSMQGVIIRLVSLPILFLVLVGGGSARQLDDDIRVRYIGIPADAFFTEWGAPVSSRPLTDGGRIYLWFSGRHSANEPGDKGTEDLIGNTAWWRGYRLQDYNPLLECRVQILTRADGYIVDIWSRTGKKLWDIQRCREVFGRAR